MADARKAFTSVQAGFALHDLHLAEDLPLAFLCCRLVAQLDVDQPWEGEFAGLQSLNANLIKAGEDFGALRLLWRIAASRQNCPQ